MRELVYKSYCWCLGTTSFRMKNFNRKIEEQLCLLDDFFALPQNADQQWTNNDALQEQYYLFLQERGFVNGDAPRKAKDARQKTSGLVDIGLIDENRRLTEVGSELLSISKSNDFESDNFLKIAKDSFIYMKQLLKTDVVVEENTVRPMIVFLYLLSQLDYLTIDEFKYLLPLCTNETNTAFIKDQIIMLRGNQSDIDSIIINTLLGKDNYKRALDYFIENQPTHEIVAAVGLNRKSRDYDIPYGVLYDELYAVFYERNLDRLEQLLQAIKGIQIGKWWMSYLFNTSNKRAIVNSPYEHIKDNVFQNVLSEDDFKNAFFRQMHLFKAKANLSDYFDLNRRYIKTSDIILFEDDTIKLDIVPKQFFNQAIEALYTTAFESCDLLCYNCSLADISYALVFNEQQIVDSLNIELSESISNIDEAYIVVEKKRYERFNALVDRKFSDENLIDLLNKFDKRQDADINSMVTDNADIPTIFEYILGIIWYKVSCRQGKILDYLKLSLDSDLLPVTHASGGEADIVYEYMKTEYYPAHAVLLEATLADSTNQRRMEMEPVSRHLGNHLIESKNLNSYCVFVTNNLNINVISDFRGRKDCFYYNTQNSDDYVNGMKIIPLATSDLRSIIMQNKKYSELFDRFVYAYNAIENNPLKWYEEFVKMN